MTSTSTTVNRTASSFDALRLFAAVTVLVGHHFFVADRHPGPPSIPGLGGIGVIALCIFFVISGYFIAESWERDPDAVRYWVRRSLRIFPALTVLTTLTILVVGPLATASPVVEYLRDPGTWAYAKNAILVFGVEYRLPGLFVDNHSDIVNLSLWSLPIELLMYALIFLFGVFARRHVRWAYPIAAVMLAATWWLVPGNERGPGLQTFNLGVFFMIGATIASFRLVRWFTMPVVVTAGAVVVVAAMADAGLTKPAMWVAFPVLVLGAGIRPSRVGSWISSRGDLSYGFYLWAFPVQQLVVMVALDRVGFWGSMFVSIAVTGICAYVSWRVIERPALDRKSSIIHRLRKRDDESMSRATATN